MTTWQVLVAPGQFSAVHGFTHKDATAESVFVRLATASATITLTSEHLLPCNGALVAAGHVRVGDILLAADGTTAVVLSIDAPIGRGLYNPHTLTGTIVVVRHSSPPITAHHHPSPPQDGIQASTYTAAAPPALAHALLAPVRWLHQWCAVDALALLGNNFFVGMSLAGLA